MLKPEASLTIGLATGVLVVAIFQGAAPTLTDGRTSKPNDDDYTAANKVAGWTAAAAVSGISLLAKDPTVFIIGGSMVIALSWWHKHAAMVDPMVKKASSALNMNEPTNATELADPAEYGYADAVGG